MVVLTRTDIQIAGMDATQWDGGNRALLAVHGSEGNRTDPIISTVARAAASTGITTVSIDLPGHGTRKDTHRLNPWNAGAEIRDSFEYLRTNFTDVNVFGCSLGTYFSICALSEAPVSGALFLAPLLDMRPIIESRLATAGISLEQLKESSITQLPGGGTLEWEYVNYVLTHPPRWKHRTHILRGKRDYLTSSEGAQKFTDATKGTLVEVDAAHYFHTSEELDWIRAWVTKSLKQ